MGTVDEIAVDVKAKIRDFTESMKDARKEMEKTQDEAEDTEESTSGMLGGATGFAGGLVTGGIVGGLAGRIARPFGNIISALLAPVLIAMLPLLKKLSDLLTDPEGRDKLIQKIRDFLTAAVRAIIMATNAILGASHAVAVALGEEGSFTAGARQAVSGTSGFLAGAGGGLAGLAGAALGGGLESELTGGGAAPRVPNIVRDRGGNHAKQSPYDPDTQISDRMLQQAASIQGTEQP